MVRDTIRVYGEEFLAPRSTPKLEDHPLSALEVCLFNIFTASLHIGGRSSLRNRKTRHSVVKGTHLSRFIIVIIIIIIISIQPLGLFWQEPEPSQATGMALACCILGKFLGVVCHCCPLPLDVPTFRRQMPPRPHERERT
jgi:hypothetical protein